MKTAIWKDTCNSVFTAVVFTIAKIQMQSKCQHRWMDKKYGIYIYTHTIEYYSAMKWTWIDLENIMFSEINQRGKFYVISFVFGI